MSLINYAEIKILIFLTKYRRDYRIEKTVFLEHFLFENNHLIKKQILRPMQDTV